MARGVSPFDFGGLQGRLWTPDHLSVKPFICLWAGDAIATTTAVTEGHLLSSWPGRYDTGAATVVNGSGGPAVYSVPVNGGSLPGVYISHSGSNNVRYTPTRNTSTGYLAWFYYGAVIPDLGEGGLFSRQYLADTGIGVLVSTLNLSYASAGGSNGNPPMFIGNSGLIRDNNKVPSPYNGWSAIHSVLGRLGPSNQGQYLDGVFDSAGFSSSVGSVPAYPTAGGTFWQIGSTGNAEQGLGGVIISFMLFDYHPTIREQQKLEGWAHHLGQTQRMLPASHPYSNNPPLIGD
jgi:hypothetical protein